MNADGCHMLVGLLMGRGQLCMENGMRCQIDVTVLRTARYRRDGNWSDGKGKSSQYFGQKLITIVDRRDTAAVEMLKIYTFTILVTESLHSTASMLSAFYSSFLLALSSLDLAWQGKSRQKTRVAVLMCCALL